MANKQTVPDTRLDGVNVLREASAREAPIAKREYGGNPSLDLAISGLNAVSEVMRVKKKIDKEQMRLETAGVLQDYRSRLASSRSEEEFDTISKAAEDDLKNRFQDRFNGKEFWNEHGEKILETNRADMAKLREQKEVDFGRQSFAEAMETNQRLLAQASAESGDKLIARGIDEIEQTPFLSEDEKQQYKTGYLQSGILNLSLNNPERALELSRKYFPDDEELPKQISETQSLRQQAEKDAAAKQQRVRDIDTFNRAFSLWHARENGDLSPAEFHILTARGGKSLLWGDVENRSETPLADAYRIIKKINSGSELSAEEYQTACNSFISAYRQHKLSIDAVSSLHNQLMLAQGDKNVSGMLFDSDVDGLADRVLLPDIDSTATTGFKRELMEQKAKLAFDIYETYYSKKTALADEFIEQGGEVTPMLEKRFRRQALQETAAELGLKENTTGELRFVDLKRVLKNVYTGTNERDIWQKFYEKAPYAEDKKALFKQIAAEEQRRELSYPHFDTLAEVEAADLEAGEKFYYRGRLAIKGAC